MAFFLVRLRGARAGIAALVQLPLWNYCKTAWNPIIRVVAQGRTPVEWECNPHSTGTWPVHTCFCPMRFPLDGGLARPRPRSFPPPFCNSHLLRAVFHRRASWRWLSSAGMAHKTSAGEGGAGAIAG